MRKYLSIMLIAALLVSLCPFHVQAAEKNLYPACVVNPSGTKFGYIDENGVFAINPIYDFVYDFNGKGIAIVANGKSAYDKCAVWFINKKNQAMSGPFKAIIPQFKEGYAVLNTDNGNFVVNDSGKTILKTTLSLGEYGDGMVIFSQQSGNKTLYGYMNLSGKIVIPAKYKYAYAFQNSSGKVELENGSYSILDKNGKILSSNATYDSSSISEGYISYYDKNLSKYGYKNSKGAVAISARYTEANAFENGYAIVRVSTGEYEEKSALIDKKGNYIFKPVYAGITSLGHGLYAVSTSENSYFNIHDYLPKAIINIKGQLLTDYIYYKVDRFQGDYAVASDNTTTFFIDQKGSIVKSLPRLNGIGTMTISGNLIKAELDSGLMYLKKNGSIIWQKNDTVSIGNGFKVKTIKYRKDFYTSVEYPEIEGLDSSIKDSVNSRLKKEFIDGYENPSTNGTIDSDEDDYAVIVEDGFNVKRNKDLLIIERTGYDYPLGAAHGMPKSDYFFVDLKKGSFYELKDLFKNGAKYTDKLAAIIQRQITLNSKIEDMFSYVSPKPEVLAAQNFYITNDSLVIYYYPYEIAPYASGFPEFEIPYGQLTDVLDTNGAFWNSFDKKVINNKVMNFNEIDDTVVNAISTCLGAYEKQMIDAINTNTFSKVESSLLTGSPLYTSQKKLVQNLYT
ncbi:MAG: WG repeat-containing protein, partial [Bacteroidota bacterium]|nr:WG repeat-containing protein [Bacteroidota bacterium]